MNPAILRAHGDALIAGPKLSLRRLGWWMHIVADETEAGFWPHHTMAASPYVRPGTAAAYIAEEMRRAA